MITSDIVTPIFDGATGRRKQCGRMDVVGDQVLGSILQVRVSDDDYQSWSNFRLVDLGMKKPHLTNCGTFQKRAYHLRHATNTPFRLQSIDLQYDIGTL